jgi:hypothetical protein
MGCSCHFSENKRRQNDMTPMTTQASGCEITQYEASYPALIRFLPTLQVANGGRSDNTWSVGVIAKEYLF